MKLFEVALETKYQRKSIYKICLQLRRIINHTFELTKNNDCSQILLKFMAIAGNIVDVHLKIKINALYIRQIF